MYSGKMAPQLIDPVLLDQRIMFLHAYPLIQEASLASRGTFSHPDQVFPLASTLHGIQIADHQLRQATKIASAPENLGREPRPRNSKKNQEQAPEASQLSQLTSNLAQVNRTNMTPSNPLQTSLSPELFSTPVPPPPPGEETNLEAASSHEQTASLSIDHDKPSIMKRKASFLKYYACHLCGWRFTVQSSLQEHLQIHMGVRFASSQQGESRIPLLLCSNAADLGKNAMEVPEAGMISDSELQHISNSLIIDGQQHTCDKSFCWANQAARHVCLNQSIDTYTMVGKQTLELCTFEERSQMDDMLVQINKPYKCNLCDKTFSTPKEVLKCSCQNQKSDVFALDEGQSILLGSVDSKVAEPDHPVLVSIKK
ncbi:Zinc finger and BTB domain-containing protein 2 [Sciurus carolinensis]|uniref:Zinc finger and BTB domain-containing protein 2 n=1 Tax=Sciurus carolinensis TaxID=30640 RepID=A0AA41T590_SCICA|nr:Zinc finger and BTB domain-containing protein 2 [Sciurus carolinensis]